MELLYNTYFQMCKTQFRMLSFYRSKESYDTIEIFLFIFSCKKGG